MRNILIKIVAVALIATLVLSAAVLITAASDSPLFKLSSATGEPGETVEVKLSIENNPGITGLSVNVGYSADCLELLSVDNAGLFEDNISTSKLTNNPVTISWFALDSADKTNNGVLAVLKFKIKDNASTSGVMLSYDEDNVFNNKFKNVRFDVENGKVSIGDDPGSTETTPASTSKPTEKPTQQSPVDSDSPALILSNAVGDPGDTVEVKLSIANNTGITGLSVNVGYSADYLELLSVDNAGLFEDSISTSKLSNNPVTVSWFALDSQNKSDNGVLAVLKFKIKDDAKSSEVKLTYDEDNIFDNKFKNVSFGIKNGRVRMSSDTDVPATEEPTTVSKTYILGDIDGDGEATVLDASFIQRYATKVKTPYPIGEPLE